MADYLISLQPQSLTAVPGQDSTFTVAASTDFAPLSSVSYGYKWYVNDSLVTEATDASYTIDPLVDDDGSSVFATVAVLTGVSTQVALLTSSTATLTVNEDVPPFDVYDLGKETGRQRHLRLHLLGYV
jgi:hypothetical protein